MPLAEAVVFAMLASYILSRTLVPTLVMLLMRGTHGRPPATGAPSLLQRIYRASTAAFERVRARLHHCARGAARQARRASRSCFLGLLPACPAGLYPVLGRDFFPTVDAGQIRLHLRAATGTRIEETARLADEVEAAIRELVPKDQLETILDNLGVPEQRHQPVVQQRRHHRHARRRDPDVAERRATGRPRSS